MNRAKWSGRRVLVTGHTGFKGTWLTAWLEEAGAVVTGVSLDAAPGCMYASIDATNSWRHRNVLGDLRSMDLGPVIDQTDPEVVFHFAAQAMVPRGYTDAETTWSTNVMGTVRVLEALRNAPSPRVALTSTTDKVYGSARRAFIESDPLIATDPYSGSKVAQEAVVSSYAQSFFSEKAHVVAARAGNVVGGGDTGENRLIPDAVRAHRAGEALSLRHPDAVRPWQHVLEPLAGYVAFAEHLLDGGEAPLALNFGPDGPATSVFEVASEFIRCLSGQLPAMLSPSTQPAWKETAHLSIDATAAGGCLGWKPRLTLDETIRWTADWYREHETGRDARRLTVEQVESYEERLQ